MNTADAVKQLYNNTLTSILYFLIERIEKCIIKNGFQLKFARLYKDKAEKALFYYSNYHKRNPDDIDTVIEFAQFLTDNNLISLSIKICEEVLKDTPYNVSLLLTMCQNCIKTGEFEKVIEYADKVLEAKADEQYAYKFKTQAYMYLKNEKMAAKTAEKTNLSILDADTLAYLREYYFRNKNFKKGILVKNTLYEPDLLKKARGRKTFPAYIYKYYEKLWHGKDLKGKTLFIFDTFSGHGDYILYARYIKTLAEQAGKIIISAPDNFYDLYKLNFPECEIILETHEEFKGHYDYTYHHELFLNLQNDLDSFPHPEGYLRADRNLIEEFSQFSFLSTNKPKIGIFWTSTSGGDSARSLNTKEIIPIIENSSYQFCALSNAEKDFETKAILKKYNVFDCAEYIKNANDTAAIMMNLDLVISTDSFPIHLAGALGIKAYLMLHKDACWRWFYETEKTDWYNSVRIFRQAENGNWADVVKKISEELKIKIKK